PDASLGKMPESLTILLQAELNMCSVVGGHGLRCTEFTAQDCSDFHDNSNQRVVPTADRNRSTAGWSLSGGTNR
ncbi:hypothetical protein OAS39_13525, partial [Pirellulales bacterium]|nr:hypothetical protein [Pirellulales bacterium]